MKRTPSTLEDLLPGVGVTEALGKLLQADPERYADVVTAIKYYLQEHRRAKAECDDGPSVAAAFHRAMDELITEAKQGDTPISCKKGCAYCCHIQVHTTPDEAELLLRYCAHAGIEIDWSRVDHQAKVERWRQLDYKSRKCVFLGQDNTCQVYLHRPMACRKYMVGSPAEQCNSEKYPNGETMLLTANKAEMMASALFSANGSATLPKQLLKAKEQLG